MRNTVPTMYTAVPTGVTNVIGHVRRNQRSRCRNTAGHLRRHSGHVPGITGHVGPEYSGIETATYLDNQRIDCITDWYDFAEAAFDLGLEEKGIKAFIKAFESAKTTDIAAALIGHAAVKLSELGLLEEVVAYSDSSVGE